MGLGQLLLQLPAGFRVPRLSALGAWVLLTIQHSHLTSSPLSARSMSQIKRTYIRFSKSNWTFRQIPPTLNDSETRLGYGILIILKWAESTYTNYSVRNCTASAFSLCGHTLSLLLVVRPLKFDILISPLYVLQGVVDIVSLQYRGWSIFLYKFLEGIWLRVNNIIIG